MVLINFIKIFIRIELIRNIMSLQIDNESIKEIHFKENYYLKFVFNNVIKRTVLPKSYLQLEMYIKKSFEQLRKSDQINVTIIDNSNECIFVENEFDYEQLMMYMKLEKIRCQKLFISMKSQEYKENLQYKKIYSTQIDIKEAKNNPKNLERKNIYKNIIPKFTKIKYCPISNYSMSQKTKNSIPILSKCKNCYHLCKNAQEFENHINFCLAPKSQKVQDNCISLKEKSLNLSKAASIIQEELPNYSFFTTLNDDENIVENKNLAEFHDNKMCSICSRFFSAESHFIHEKICFKVFYQKRSPFNTVKKRIISFEQLAIEKHKKFNKSDQKETRCPNKWRENSSGFRKYLKSFK
jgi:hypothetical protein